MAKGSNAAYYIYKEQKNSQENRNSTMSANSSRFIFIIFLLLVLGLITKENFSLRYFVNGYLLCNECLYFLADLQMNTSLF